MNSTFDSTNDLSNKISNTIPAGQVACSNCNAFFNPSDYPRPNCPSCGLHYQETICMHCGQNFPTPAWGQIRPLHSNCPYQIFSSFPTIVPGIAEYEIVTDFPLDEDYFLYGTTEYPAPLPVTDYPFGNDYDPYYYPRLIQYNPNLPLGSERSLTFADREYPLDLTSRITLECNQRVHVRGMSLLCNTTNTPQGARLHIRLRDRKQCLQLEDVITPEKAAKANCMFDFDRDLHNEFRRFSNDLCVSLWWEKNGTVLDADVILPSATQSNEAKWEDKQGTLFTPALVLYSYVYDKVTYEQYHVLTSYPTTSYPSSSSDNQESGYPVPDSLIFDLREPQDVLFSQMGYPGSIEGRYTENLCFTIYAGEIPNRAGMCVNGFDLGIPSEQFGNAGEINVQVILENSSPISVTATWINTSLLKVDMAAAGIPVERRTTTGYTAMVKIPSRDSFFAFFNGDPVGAVYGHINTQYPDTPYPDTPYPDSEYPVPDSLIFDLREPQDVLFSQMGYPGSIEGRYTENLYFTIYAGGIPNRAGMCVNGFDLGIPSEQFGNIGEIDVLVILENSSPISMTATWINASLLKVDMAAAGIAEARRTTSGYTAMVKIPSRSSFFAFFNGDPVGAVYGHINTRYEEQMESSENVSPLLSEVQRANSIPLPRTMPTQARPESFDASTKISTEHYTDYPKNDYLSAEYSTTNYPTDYVTAYPAAQNGTDNPAMTDWFSKPTCFCPAEDGSCDKDDDDNGGGDDNSGGGGGGGGGGNNGGGSGGGSGGAGGSGGNGGSNLSSGLGMNDKVIPGMNLNFATYPDSLIPTNGRVSMGNRQTLSMALATPGAINYEHMTQRRVAGINSPTGVVNDASKVCIVTEKGYPRFSQFDSGYYKAYPADRTQTKPEQLEKITISLPDGSGLPPQSSWLQETLADGTLLRYSTTTGEAAAIKPPKQEWSTPQDWEQNVRVIYEDPDNPGSGAPAPSITNGIENAIFKRPGNIRQIWSKQDGLLDITTQSSTQYTITRYALADVGTYNAQTRLYSIKPGAVPVKQWVMQSELISYTTKADGKKYEIGTNRLLSEYDLGMLRSFTVTESRGEEKFVSRWEQPDSSTMIYTRGEGDEAETIVTTRTATDPDTLENLKAEYQAVDMAYLRVGDTFTREVEETRTVPGIPGGTRVRYRRYPFGDVCTLWEQGVDTALSRTVTYKYELDKNSPNYGCCIQETYSSGKVVKMAYDVKKRLIIRQEPWAGGTSQITRYTYCSQPEYLYRVASEKKTLLVEGNWLSSGRDWEKLISCKQYAYIDTPALKEEKVTHTAFAWQDLERTIPAEPQISITQWYGENAQANGANCAYAAGRLKMRRDVSGRETYYRYRNSNEPGIAYICTITHTAEGRNIPGKTTQTVYYYDENERSVRIEEYCHTGEEHVLVTSERYTRDDMNRVIRTDKANGKHTSTLWSCNGPVQQTDEDGVSTYYQYNSAKRLVSITQESPDFAPQTSDAGVYLKQLPCRTVEYFYDAAGRLIQEKTTLGQTVTYRSTEWDALDRVISDTDDFGLVTSRSYSANGLQTTTTLPTGATLVTIHHKDGALLKQEGTGWPARYYSYRLWIDSLFTRVIQRSPGEAVVEDTFTDGYGRTILTMTPRGTGRVVQHMLYDEKGNLSFTRTSHQGTGTEMGYDSFGRLVKQVQDQGTAFGYRTTETNQSYVLKTINPDFLATDAPEWTRGPLVWKATVQSDRVDEGDVNSRTTKRWNLVSETLPHVSSATLTQSPLGVMTAEWVENNQGNIFRYKAVQGSSKRSYTITLGGKTFKQSEMTGEFHTWEYNYLSEGLKEIIADSRNNKQTAQYDPTGRILKQTDAAGNSTLYEYSSTTGHLKKVTNPEGKTTCYDRDNRGRTIAVYGTAVQPARFEYDEADRITALHTWRTPGLTLDTSPLSRTDGDITRWNYDIASGALRWKTMADGQSINYSYDSTGMLIKKYWPRGLTIYYSYSAQTEQLLSIEYNDGTPGITYTRNGWGQITSVTDAAGKQTFAYDHVGNLIEETRSGAYAETIAYGLNDTGLQGGYSLALSGSACQEVHYEYGNDLRINRINTPGDKSYAYTWKANSPFLEKLAWPNGLTRDYTYDRQRDLLTGIQYRNGSGASVFSHSYSYNQLGQLVSRNSGSNTTSNHGYSYNDRGEVTGHTLEGGDQWTYSYDNIGNRLQSFKNTTGREYTANQLNQYTQIAPITTSGDETVLPTYDRDGNQTLVNTESGNWKVSWNAENRPVTFVRGDKRIECIYDYMGRRVQKTVLLKNVPVSCRRYAYKGYQLVAELDALGKDAQPEPVKSWTWDPTRSQDATPLEIAFWKDETVDTQYPGEEQPTTAYPDTEYPDTEFPETAYPDEIFPEEHFFSSANKYWHEPREQLNLRYLQNGQVSLDLQNSIPEGEKIYLDRINLAVDGNYSGWSQYGKDYNVEIRMNQQDIGTVYAELDGNTLKINFADSYGRAKHILNDPGKIDIKVKGLDQNGFLRPIDILPCYHDATGIPLAHVSGIYVNRSNEVSTTGYPTTEYPDTEFPTTQYSVRAVPNMNSSEIKYSNVIFPEGYFFTSADLYWNEPREGLCLYYRKNGQISIGVQDVISDEEEIRLDRLELAIDGAYAGWLQYEDEYKVDIQLEHGNHMSVFAELDGDTLKIDISGSYPGASRILNASGVISMTVMGMRKYSDLKGWEPVDTLPCYYDAAGRLLAHISGVRVSPNSSSEKPPTTAYPDTEYPDTAYPTPDYPDNLMPTFFEPSKEDLIFRDTQENADLNYLHSTYDQIEYYLNGVSAEHSPVVIDTIELALDNLTSEEWRNSLVCLIHLEHLIEVVPEYRGDTLCLNVKGTEPIEENRRLVDKLRIDFRKRNPQTGELSMADYFCLWYQRQINLPLLHVTGSIYREKTSYPTTNYPETEYPTPDYPTDYPDNFMPTFFDPSEEDLVFRDTQEKADQNYLHSTYDQVEFYLNGVSAEHSPVVIDTIELALDSRTSEEWRNSLVCLIHLEHLIEVVPEYRGDTLCLNAKGAEPVEENRRLVDKLRIDFRKRNPQTGELSMADSSGLWYRKLDSQPLLRVTGSIYREKTDYPTTNYPETEYPTTDYPTTDYPDYNGTFFHSSENNLILRERRDNDYFRLLGSDMIVLGREDIWQHEVIIDKIIFPINPLRMPAYNEIRCRVDLRQNLETVARIEGNYLTIDLQGEGFTEDERFLNGRIEITFHGDSPDNYPQICFWWREWNNLPLLCVTGTILDTPYPAKSSTTESAISTPVDNGFSAAPAPHSAFALGRTILPANSAMPSSISLDGNAFPDIVTRYDEEFFHTGYPYGQDFTLMSPTFFPDYSDTVWIRPSSTLSPYELGDSIHFNLNDELPSDKELLIDSLQIIIYPDEPASSLSIELYLNNKCVKTISSLGSYFATFDLKNSGIPEKDRTLSFRKNITVRFKKDGQPYPKVPVCCVSPGKPVGLVRGSLKDRTIRLPQHVLTCLTDHNKNVTGLADEQGNLAATFDYDAFGNIIRQTGTTASRNPLRFSSEYHDVDLGLIYYNYRHYNPKDGRWISRDPIEEKSGLNLYSLLFNNSIKSIDVLGLNSCRDYFHPDPGTPGMLQVHPNNWTTGASQEAMDSLFSAVKNAEKIKDPKGNKCYSIDIKTDPLTIDGIKTLPLQYDKVILLSHTKTTRDEDSNITGFEIQSDGEYLHSSELSALISSGKFIVHGCHDGTVGDKDYLTTLIQSFEAAVAEIQKLKQKECCVPTEKIVVATGTL